MSENSDLVTTMVAAIPFCAHLGLGPAHGGGLALPDEERLRNHVGTAHAGALFTVGEAASGVAVMSALPELARGGVFVVKNASIEYKKPARGRVNARGTVREGAEAIRSRMSADGKATFDVDITLRDAADVEVATMLVTWYARPADAKKDR